MARILHNNRVKFPKDFFSIVLYTNMAAMTSSENHLYMQWRKWRKIARGLAMQIGCQKWPLESGDVGENGEISGHISHPGN